MRLLTDGPATSVPARVARCYVSSVHPEAVRYRAALAFDQPSDTVVSSVG